MAQPSYPYPISVIGPPFIVPHPFEIIVDTYSGGNLVITDVNHTILLKVKPCDTSFHHQRVLLDVNDTPVVMLREKIRSFHKRWKAYRGDSTFKSDKLFSTKTPSVIQFKTGLDVFLAKKSGCKDVCDFKIRGSWSNKNCTISFGNSKSSTTIAQIHKVQESKFNEGKFMVTIYQNVDYAFVVAILAIIDAMKCVDAAAAKAVVQIIGSTSQVILGS